jgi:NADPH2:quinone reductase
VPVPDDVDDETAAAALLQGMTAQYLSNSTYPVQPGDTVVVHAAAGGVGLLLTQMVKMRGGRVIGTASTDEKAALARDAGADEVVAYQGFAARVRDLTDGAGAAAIYDGVGKTTFEGGLDVLRPRGYMVLFGGSSGAVPPFDSLVSGSLFLTRPGLPAYATREELLGPRGRLRLDRCGNAPRAHRRPVPAGGRAASEDLEARRTTGKLLLMMSKG